MPEISRRQVIQGVAGASLAALTSTTISGCKKPARTPLTTPDPSLYLIFTGAWAFYFPDNNTLTAATTHFPEHRYDLGISRPDGLPRMPLTEGKNYTVKLQSPSDPPASIGSVLDAMARSGQGLILKSSACKPTIPAGARTVSLPIPSLISPAALIHPVKINLDQSVMQTSVTKWPTALVLVYSGNWGGMTITSDPTEPTVSLKAGDLPYSHVSFRTCLASECNMPPDCTIDCTKINNAIAHASDVLKSILGLLGLANVPNAPFTFDPCIPAANGHSDQWDLVVERGPNNNIYEPEVGMPEIACDRYSQLHNCAAGTVIVAP
jgi:hypothetical protein